MRTRLGTLSTAVTTVAFAAGAVAWPASHRRAIGIAAFGPGGRPAVAVASGGTFHLLLSNVPTGPRVAWTVDVRHESRGAFEGTRDDLIAAADWQAGDAVVLPPPSAVMTTMKTVTHNRYGLAVGWGRTPFGEPGTWFGYASAPAWLVVPLLSVVPARAARRWAVRRRRAWAGACLRCGYDLRGSPARCPECGLTVAGRA